MTLPYRAAGILLNGKEADLNQNAGSIERQLRVHSRWGAGTQNMKSHADMARQSTAAPQPR